MKRLILGLALVAAVAACKSQTNKSVSDAESAAVKTDCCAEKGTCADKAACTGEKTDCSTGETCPVTGKKIN